MAIDRRSVPEKAKETVELAIKKILSFSEKARKEGLLSLSDSPDNEALKDRNNLFEYGMSLVIDGVDYSLIKEILCNIQGLKEPSYTQKLVDNVYIAGVLGIQCGHHPDMLLRLLDSLVPEQSRSDWLKTELTNKNLGI